MAFVIVVFVTGIGSILGLTLYATRLHIPLLLFEGPTYLFFILVGSTGVISKLLVSATATAT